VDHPSPQKSSKNLLSYASILCIVLLLNQSVSAETPLTLAAPQQAAIPAQPALIRTAKKIFLANAGAQTGFPFDGSVAYQEFSNHLQAWGRYALVAAPADADLIFELRSAAPVGGVEVIQGTGGSYRLPQLQLTIIDPRTQTHLWVVSEPVYQTLNRKDRTDWFSVSVANLTTKVKQLAGDPVTPTETAQLEQVPRAGHHRWIWAVPIGIVAVGVSGGFLLHHEFENSLANMKASQDAFCAANNIPLSECAGG